MSPKPYLLRFVAALTVTLVFTSFPVSADTECRRFDPHGIEVVEAFGSFGLADRTGLLFPAGVDRAEARVALFVILHYRIDEVCGVGGLDRPVLTYFLANGRAPRGRSPGEDCVRFDQAGARLYDHGGQWVLADRNQDIVALGRDQALAEEAVDAIRNKNFSEICYIGGANAALTYFLY